MSSRSHTITFRYPDSRIGATRSVDVHASPDEIAQLLEQGYFSRKQLFSPEQVARLRVALDEIAEAESREGNTTSVNSRFGGHFIRHVYDKHPAFLELINYAPIVSVARAVLGPAVQTRLSARISIPGQPNQQTEWHYHQWLVIPDPAPPLASFPYSIDFLVYLDDVNEANGPLALIPGSHHFNREIPADDHNDQPGQQLVCFAAGDGVFIHNNLWHRALPTRPDGTRRRLLAFSYCPVWIKNVNDGPPPENGLTKTLHNSPDREIRELIGQEGYR